MMLKSIEKLRGEIKDDLERTCGSSTSVRSERVLSALGEIEREIAERYMPLSLDADEVRNAVLHRFDDINWQAIANELNALLDGDAE